MFTTRRKRDRSGNVLVLTALLMIVMFAVLALAVDIGRVTGATHVILGDVSPGLYNEMRVGLRVVEVDTGMVMEQINFKFKRAQFEGWVP